jgi:hypothetical protein
MRLPLSRRIAVFLLGVGLCLAGAVSIRSHPDKAGTFGFDEVHYLHLLRSGWSSVHEGTTGSYYASRALPFLIVRLLFGYHADQDWNLPAWSRDMTVLSAACLIFTGWVLWRALRVRGNEALTPYALLLLVATKAFLGFYIYYPMLGDVFAMGVSALFLHGFFQGIPFLQWAALAASVFTSPLLSAFLFLILSFSRSADASPSRSAPPRSQVFWAACLAIPVLAIAVAAFTLVPDSTIAVARGWGNPKYFEQPVLVALAFALAALAIRYAVLPAAHWRLRDYLRALRPGAAAAGICLLLAATLWVSLQAAVVTEQDAAFAGRGLLIKFSYLLGHPGPVGIPSNLLFYGVAPAALLVNWRRFAGWLAYLGPGVALAFSFTMALFGLDGEVRHVTMLVPLAVLGATEICREPLVRIGIPVLLLWAAVLSLSWIPFLYLDPSYEGERQLSAFGMCWSVPHYFAALAMAGTTAAAAWRWLRLPALDNYAGKAHG